MVTERLAHRMSSGMLKTREEKNICAHELPVSLIRKVVLNKVDYEAIVKVQLLKLNLKLSM